MAVSQCCQVQIPKTSGLEQSRKASGRVAWELGLEEWIYVLKERRVGEVGQLERQKCSDAFSNGQGLDIRQTCLGYDGRVCAKHRVQTYWVHDRDSEGTGLRRTGDAHTDRLREILKARQKHLGKIWVLRNLCMFWSKE